MLSAPDEAACALLWGPQLLVLDATVETRAPSQWDQLSWYPRPAVGLFGSRQLQT